MSKLWKIVKLLFLVAVAFFLLDVVLVIFFSVYRPQIQKTDAVVVLGAAIYTPALYNRSLEGLRLYEDGKASMVVVSGGRISDKDISEAGYMRKVIESEASGPVPIILEEDSHSTYENLKNTQSKIGEDKSIIIVSDKFHLARAVLLAKRMGFSPVYWSAPKPAYYSKKDLAYYYMREVFAMVSYIPKFLRG